jgi:predicted heme/steroid binding protein
MKQFTEKELAQYNGKKGKPAYVGYICQETEGEI